MTSGWLSKLPESSIISFREPSSSSEYICMSKPVSHPGRSGVPSDLQGIFVLHVVSSSTPRRVLPTLCEMSDHGSSLDFPIPSFPISPHYPDSISTAECAYHSVDRDERMSMVLIKSLFNLLLISYTDYNNADIENTLISRRISCTQRSQIRSQPAKRSASRYLR